MESSDATKGNLRERRGTRAQFPDRAAWATMSSSTRPPAGLEFKGAASMLAPTPTAPTPDTATVTPEGVVELIAAVTGIQDDVGDIIRPGVPSQLPIITGWTPFVGKFRPA